MIVWNCGAIVVPDITWVQASGRQRLNGAQKVDTQEVFFEAEHFAGRDRLYGSVSLVPYPLKKRGTFLFY